MSNASDFVSGAKPKLITVITSGTGTYVVDTIDLVLHKDAGAASGQTATRA